MTASEVLRKAREKIQIAERWHILDAIREACPRQGAYYYAAIDELHTACAPPDGESLAGWMREGRTLAEVLSLFDRAIAAAEARGE